MNPLTYHRIEKLTLEIRQRQDEILRLLNSEPAEQTVTSISDVISTVAGAFEIRTSDILSNSRLSNYKTARHVAMWICVKIWHDCQGLRMTKTEIAKQFGKSHGALLWAVNNVNDWRDTDEKFRKQTDELLEMCRIGQHPKQMTLFKAA